MRAGPRLALASAFRGADYRPPYGEARERKASPAGFLAAPFYLLLSARLHCAHTVDVRTEFVLAEAPTLLAFCCATEAIT